MDKKILMAVLLAATLLITNAFWLVNYQGLSLDNSKLQDLADAKDTELSTLNGQITLLQAQQSTLTAQYQSLQADYASLSDLNSELQGDYDNLTIQYLALQSNQSLVYGQLLDLQANYSLLYDEYADLQSAYSSLEGEKNSLQAQYDELLDQYELLSGQYQDLQDQFLLLQNQYQNLSVSYNAVNQQLSYLNMVRLDSLDLDYYITIREDYGGAIFNQDKVDFCAQLSKHDRAAYYWPVADSTYYDITGYHRYYAAFATQLSVLNLVGVKGTDSAAVEISKILSFIDGNITFQYDMYDRYFAPTETLSSGTGDCDDFSILASSMFEMMGIQSAIAYFQNSYGGAHAMVLVHLPDLGGYGYYYYSDLTSLGLASGKWIIIEPQTLIQNQDDSSWFSQWIIEVAAET